MLSLDMQNILHECKIFYKTHVVMKNSLAPASGKWEVIIIPNQEFNYDSRLIYLV